MHFTVMVIGNDPEKQLAPYSENLTDEKGNCNPYGFWDWYQLGGRWTGFFKLKEGATDSIGRPGLNTEKAEKGYVDQALKKDIDFEGMIKDCLERKEKLYDKINEILNGHPKLVTWNELVDKYRCKDCYSEEKYKECMDGVYYEYWSQLGIEALKRSGYENFILSNNIDLFSLSKEEYLEIVKYECIVPYAFIENGRWIAKGEMGWFFSNDKYNQIEWDKLFIDSLNKLPDDTLLSLYDCHI